MFLKSVINKNICAFINAVMYIAIFPDSINIHRFFNRVEAIAATNRTTIPEEQTKD